MLTAYKRCSSNISCTETILIITARFNKTEQRGWNLLVVLIRCFFITCLFVAEHFAFRLPGHIREKVNIVIIITNITVL